MRKLSHESLAVYQRSIGFVAWSSEGPGKQSGKEQIVEIVAMLTSLAKSAAGDRINKVPVS